VTPLHQHRSAATSNDRVGSSASLPAEGGELQVLLAQLRDPNLRFPARPAFVADLDVFEMPDGLGFQFRGAETPVILRGRTVAPVVGFLEETLDGTMTLDTLLHACPPEIGAVTLVRSLLLLHGKGLLTDAAAAPSSAVAGDETQRRQLLYWGRHLDLTRSASSSGEIERRLSTAEVVVVGTGIFGSVTADLLARSGCARLRLLALDDDGFLQAAMAGTPSPPLEVVRLETTAVDSALDALRVWIDDADLLVTATCDAPNALFRGINSLSLQRRRRWLHGNSDGSTIDLGPLVQPFESACYACLELRRRSAEGFAIENELYQARLAAERESGTRNVIGEAVWPATLAASILVGEACRVLSGLAPATLVDSVLRLTPLTGIVEQNQVTRVPRCPECYRGAIPAHGVDTQPLLTIEAATP
jgi:bacteriocin biosynthesis cyclodehydratase domain-containing protein